MPFKSTKYGRKSGYNDLDNESGKKSTYHTRAVRSTFAKILAVGGNVERLEPGNGYVYHTFTDSGFFEVLDPSLTSIEILLVAGGGAGGGPMGGGGGAGGLLYGTYSVSAGQYSVVVGDGGNPGGFVSGVGNSGSDSTFFPTPVAPNPAHPTYARAKGGGGGGSYLYSYPGQGGNPGGSGGGVGGGYPSTPGASITPTTTQTPSAGLTGYGYGGGTGSPAPYAASGGGGAGGNGSPANVPSLSSGDGGAGRQYPQFTGTLIGVPPLSSYSGYYAAGGGGSGYPNAGPEAPGYTSPTQDFTVRRNNIGGAGHNNLNPSADPKAYGFPGGPGGLPAPALLIERVYATDNTGSGGGGGAYSYPAQNGAGGSGICCIRYLRQ